jgi:hypothetical protein
MYDHLPAAQRLQMRRWMETNCPACPVYALHRPVIDAKIAAM